jgi:polar amino acid transport system substrate-binding protein
MKAFVFKMRQIIFSILLTVTGVFSVHVFAQGKAPDLISVYTENYPPFNFMNLETGEVSGFATEIVRNILDDAGLRYEIKLLPWKRAVRAVQTEENALIYTIVRAPLREDQYRWLAPISGADFHIFMRADDKRTPSYEALKVGEYTASCVAQDITCDLLIELGIPEENITAVPNDKTGDFRMVVAGRTDIFIGDDDIYRYLKSQEKIDVSLVRKALPVNIKTGFYLAGNVNMSDAIAQKIVDAHAAMNQDD